MTEGQALWFLLAGRALPKGRFQAPANRGLESEMGSAADRQLRGGKQNRFVERRQHRQALQSRQTTTLYWVASPVHQAHLGNDRQRQGPAGWCAPIQARGRG